MGVDVVVDQKLNNPSKEGLMKDLEMRRKTILQFLPQAQTDECGHAAMLDGWGKSYPTNSN